MENQPSFWRQAGQIQILHEFTIYVCSIQYTKVRNGIVHINSEKEILLAGNRLNGNIFPQPVHGSWHRVLWSGDSQGRTEVVSVKGVSAVILCMILVDTTCPFQ